jgi:hypothetical protein|tara:strand:- start:213 stop:359 length:147 start_codon:yes stop_codon:yes gene_type:complete
MTILLEKYDTITALTQFLDENNTTLKEFKMITMQCRDVNGMSVEVIRA